MKHTTIAADIAKNVFEIAVSHYPGQVAETHRLSRSRFLPFFIQREAADVVMEACGMAHYWARQLQQLGHYVVLLPPQYVRPYVQRNKTDRTDAKGLLEAHRNKDIRPVPIKSVEQQTLASLHRFRSAWLATRTARINTVRGILRELGIFIPLGAKQVVPRVRSLIEDADLPIPIALRDSLHQACQEIQHLESLMQGAEHQLRALARQMPTVQRLLTIPGIGILTATALVAFVGDVQRFRSCRHFASYLGLTPREHSSGNTRRLGRISKRGDVYLRTLLTHGARAVLWAAAKHPQPDRLRSWALALQHRRGHNKATIALANKLARIIWAVWKRGTEYQVLPNAA
jgi:transposase